MAYLHPDKRQALERLLVKRKARRTAGLAPQPKPDEIRARLLLAAALLAEGGGRG